MTVYIRPNGDDKNDGSEKAPVKSPKRAITIANQNKDNEINLLTTDWARINRALDADTGSDGSTPQARAAAAGFTGTVAETVAINPALAISGIEIMNQWYYRPDYMAIMSDCGYTKMGVWSANSLDRTVVVAVYGKPS